MPGDVFGGLATGGNIFSEEKVDESFYNVIFPKKKYQGSFDMFQKLTRFHPGAKSANADEQRLLRLERSVGIANSSEKKGLSNYSVGLEYYASKHKAKKETITRSQALSGYNEYLTDKETYGGYLDKSQQQMYEMSRMYGDDLNFDNYVEYQSMENKMRNRSTFKKIGDTILLNYATLSPEDKAFYNDFWGKIDEGGKGLKTRDWAEYYKLIAMNNLFSSVAVGGFAGSKAGTLAGPTGIVPGAIAGASVSMLGALQELATGDTNFAKDISRGLMGGLGQTSSIMGQSMMELDYRMGFKGLTDKMGSINPENGYSDENLQVAYESQQEYLHDISPVGMLGDLLYNFGNSISMSGTGRTQALYEGGFQKDWYNWALSYIPQTIGQVYGTVLLSKGIGKLGMGTTAGVEATANSSKLMQIMNGTKNYVKNTAPLLFMFSSSEAWTTRENMIKSGKFTEAEADREANKTLYSNIGLMTATGAVPGQYSKLARKAFGGNKLVTYGLVTLDTLLEGVEEVSQDAIQASAMDEEYKLASQEAIQTFALGMVGGMFGGVNVIVNDKVNNSFIKNIGERNASIQSKEITDIISRFNNGEVDSETATVEIFEEMKNFDGGEQLSQQIYSQSATSSVVQDIVGGVKHVYDQVKIANQKAVEKKKFIKNDLDLDGMSSEVANGVYTINLLDRNVNFEDNYRITDQVVRDLRESDKYKDISEHDNINNKVLFTEVPTGFSVEVKKESQRRLEVKKKIDNNSLTKTTDNKETLESLLKSEVMEPGDYAKVLKETFGEMKTPHVEINSKIDDSTQIKSGVALLDATKIDLTEDNLSKLKDISDNILSSDFLGYVTKDRMSDQLSKNKFIDNDFINKYAKIPDKYDELKAKFDEQEKIAKEQDVVKKAEQFEALKVELSNFKKDLNKRIQDNKELKEKVKESGEKINKLTLNSVQTYEALVNDDINNKVVVFDDKKPTNNEISIDKTKTVEQIGTTKEELNITKMRKNNKDNVVKKGIMFISKGDYIKFQFEHEMISRDANIVLNMLDTNKFKIKDKSVSRKVAILENQFSKKVSTELVGNGRLAGSLIVDIPENTKFSEDMVYGDFIEAFGVNLLRAKENFKGISVVSFKKGLYDSLVKQKKNRLQPNEFLTDLSTVFSEGESDKEIKASNQKIKDSAINLISERRSIDKNKATDEFNKFFELNFISKDKYIDAFSNMFNEDNRDTVKNVLLRKDDTSKKQENTKKKEMCG